MDKSCVNDVDAHLDPAPRCVERLSNATNPHEWFESDAGWSEAELRAEVGQLYSAWVSLKQRMRYVFTVLDEREYVRAFSYTLVVTQ